MNAARSDFIAELARDITQEATATAKEGGEKSRQAIKADLNTLNEQLIDAVVNRRDEVVAKAYEAVERSYSEIVTKCGLDEQAFDAQTTAAELRGLTRFLGAALQYRKAPKASAVVREGAYRPLLQTLCAVPNGLSSGDLAKKLKVEPATVARKLPYLRSIELVRSQQVGKTMINRVTPSCEMLLRDVSAEEAQAEREAEGFAGRMPSRTLADAVAPEAVVVAKRVVMVTGNTVKIDGEAHPSRHAGFKFEYGKFEYGKAAPKRETVVEVVGAGNGPGFRPMAEFLTTDVMAASLCQLNTVAGKEGVEGFYVHFDPDNHKVIAHLESVTSELAYPDAGLAEFLAPQMMADAPPAATSRSPGRHPRKTKRGWWQR
jgi:hypothetical protein